jgi:methylenetetrahydrofolate--tRNA-(uracil-5-)-methyltransferase
MIGALSRYAANGGEADFQPMGANFGIMPSLNPHIRDKKERYAAFSARSLQNLEQILSI